MTLVKNFYVLFSHSRKARALLTFCATLHSHAAFLPFHARHKAHELREGERKHKCEGEIFYVHIESTHAASLRGEFST